jgi:hypothetical protein
MDEFVEVLVDQMRARGVNFTQPTELLHQQRA